MNKKQENKYYTPELKEFHVGFEYKQELGYSWSINTPEDYVIEFQDKIFEIENINFINTLLEAGLIKVKYLDKDDIEELGFKYIKYGWFEKENVTQFNGGVYKLRIGISKGYKTLITLTDSSIDDEHIFNGIIKNKSELKDILEKLGI